MREQMSEKPKKKRKKKSSPKAAAGSVASSAGGVSDLLTGDIDLDLDNLSDYSD